MNELCKYFYLWKVYTLAPKNPFIFHCYLVTSLTKSCPLLSLVVAAYQSNTNQFQVHRKVFWDWVAWQPERADECRVDKERCIKLWWLIGFHQPPTTIQLTTEIHTALLIRLNTYSNKKQPHLMLTQNYSQLSLLLHWWLQHCKNSILIIAIVIKYLCTCCEFKRSHPVGPWW